MEGTAPLTGQVVVNNQGRIGKALIPSFVLLHLLEAAMGGRGDGDGGIRDTGFTLEWMLFTEGMQ